MSLLGALQLLVALVIVNFVASALLDCRDNAHPHVQCPKNPAPENLYITDEQLNVVAHKKKRIADLKPYFNSISVFEVRENSYGLTT